MMVKLYMFDQTIKGRLKSLLFFIVYHIVLIATGGNLRLTLYKKVLDIHIRICYNNR